MAIRLSVHAFFGRQVVHGDLEIEAGGAAPGGKAARAAPPMTLKLALQEGGKALGFDILQAIRRGAQPVIMINGNRVDLPAGLDADLEEGDQISVISPLGGG